MRVFCFCSRLQDFFCVFLEPNSLLLFDLRQSLIVCVRRSSAEVALRERAQFSIFLFPVHAPLIFANPGATDLARLLSAHLSQFEAGKYSHHR